MVLSITVAEIAVALRITADPAVAPPEPYLGILTRLQTVAENQIERYAATADAATKSEAAIRMIGYLVDQPTATQGSSFANAFRNSGAQSLLADYRSPIVIDLDDATDTPSPSPHVLQVVGGLSANATPVASELTILPTTPGIIPFPAFIDMHLLIWRPRADGPVNSIIFDDDTTRTNQITGFAVSPVDITVGHLVGSVWVSHQLLTFATSRNAEVR